MIEMDLADERATAALAVELAARAIAGDVIALKGDLGTGKTSFARAFIRARGAGDEEVPSPTFTLAQFYELASGTVWHFDLYRLAAPEEAWELGIEEALADAITLIEWPERLGPLLPARRLELGLSFAGAGTGRHVTLDPGRGGAAEGWAARLAGLAAGA
jgi:tRNA threonylcarbamoyladenosine biosynthesis protein TsaE